jgi:UrcA family protein
MKNLLVLAALFAAPLAAPLAASAETAQPQQIQISSAGLDLANPADAAAMIGRIEAAVRPMCVAPGFANGRTTAGCVRETTKAAIKSLRIPQLDFALNNRSVRGNPVALG